MYKTDKEIIQEFSNFKILSIEIKNTNQSGWIELLFPNGKEHVGGGTNELVDKWIKYDDGRIAFDNWYPEDVYWQLVNKINKKLEV